MPKIIASVVIRMGRSRTRAACSRACERSHALLAHADGEVDQQDGVLGHQPHQHHDADHREHRQRGAEQQQGQHHADQRQRQRGHQRQGLQEALELAGQDHVDEDHAIASAETA
jgi:hypothetical protein